MVSEYLWYSEFPHYNDSIRFNDIAIKMNLCCKESLISRMICKKCLVLYLFLHRTHVLDVC